MINDYLWSDETGLPGNNCSEVELATMTEDALRHVYRAYPTLPSPFYSDVEVA